VRFKTKDLEDRYVAQVWDELRKYNPFFALSLVKTERILRESKFGKAEDQCICIIDLEDLQVNLEVMGTGMANDQFKIES
jgi:predicted solute-binding protein